MKREISMPYWCVANPVGDPFGPAVMDRIDSVRVTDILWNSFPEIAEILKTGDPKKISSQKMDYKSMNETALRIGELDMRVNKKLLGL